MLHGPVSRRLRQSNAQMSRRRKLHRTLLGFERLENRHLLAGDITIYAAGETGEETMELLIDGAVVRTWTNVTGNPANRTFLPFTFSVGTSVTPDRIRVSFTNDYYVDGVADRNLYVDKIVVDGATYETEHPSVYSTGSWKPEDGIVPGYRQSEVLNANGYFQYAALSSSGSTIRILAAGSTGNENMSLLIDDVQVASWTAVGGSADLGTFNEFVYRATSTVSAGQIKVVFTNDVYSPPVDYNLRVDSLNIDGVQFETESPSTYSTGTYVPESGQVLPGYWKSEWLHSNGYFQYAAHTNGSTIRIRAAGSTGNENMSLLIDDIQVASWTAVGGSADVGTFNEFIYRATSTISAKQIKVAYTNDVYSPPVDYNLRVDSLNVDGILYETESPSTYSTGTYVPENGQVLPGYWKSEWLHANGYFHYDKLVAQPGALGLESSSIGTREGNGSVSVAVLRSSGSDGTVSIDYKINQGTATAGGDYTTSAGTLVFQPGEIRRTVFIPLLNDSVGEAPETFSFVIENPQGGATLMAPRTATITITDDDLVLPNYTSFPSGAGLKLNGNAAITSNTLQVTPNASSQRGTAFHTTAIPIKLDTSFQAQFQFVTLGTTNGGEGLTFMLQNDSRGTSALGSGASGLGYSGITKSLAVEFDTVRGSGEVNANHVSIWRNGSLSSSLATQTSNVDFNSGQPVNVWIDYDGDKDALSVYISSTTTKPTTPTVTATVDITALVGSQAYFGFSAATSSLVNAHRITSWRMNLDRPGSGTGTTPPTLVNQTIASGLTLPTAVEFDPSGRNLYVAEKQGKVVVVRDGVTLSTPFIDISNQTNSASDRGLLDVALHPNFPATPYVYLLYTFDPPEVYQNASHEFAGPDKTGNRAGRLLRVTADAATNYTTAVAGSELVLLGKNSTWNHFNGFINSTTNIDAPAGGVDANGNYVQDFIASDSESHTVADLAFAPDGSLYVAIGDGASYNTVDPRAVRVQHVDSLSGKVLRINPLDGRGYASNPFSDGNLDSNRSKVYQLGLRNPFRMSVDPASGRLFIGDVGWTQWEEIDSGAAGANFGWPFYEGASGTSQRTPGYESLPEAQAFYASGAPVTASLYALNHAADGINAIIMGAYYSGSTYPAQYQGNLFFNDLGQGIVRTAKLDAAGKVTSIETFATGAAYVVQITQGPDGNLYYVDLDNGIIGRWQFVTESSAATSSASTQSFAVQSTMTSSSLSGSGTETTSPVAEPVVSGKKAGSVSASSKRQWAFTAPKATESVSRAGSASGDDAGSQSLVAKVISKLAEKLDLRSRLGRGLSRK